MDAVATVDAVSTKLGIFLKDRQRDALVHLLNQKGDLLVNLPVGYGKSLIYSLLPNVLSAGRARPVVIVFSPLNIIQKDQIQSLKRLGIKGCIISQTGKVDCSTETDQFPVDLSSVKKCDYQVILCHPESVLHTPEGRDLLNDECLKANVVALVIDECHITEKWGGEFRTSFQKLGSLRAFYPGVPFVALSGTLTVQQKQTIPRYLGMKSCTIIEHNPDRKNIYLEKYKKDSDLDVLGQYERIVHPICDALYQQKESFPITLIFIPVFYMSQAVMYLQSLFGTAGIDQAIYSAICSGQDDFVINYTISELKKENSKIRLVLTTSIAGMGFDPDNVTQVIHTCPPRSMSQYLQEVGRAGRRGQSAKAILYYSEISKNLPGIVDDIVEYCLNDTSCLRNQMLSVFGFEKDSGISGAECCSYCSMLMC